MKGIARAILVSALIVTGLAFVAGSPAFADRDESQRMQQQAEQLAQAKQQQRRLAGPVGVPGRIGPEGQPARFRRDPSNHP